MSKDKKRDEVSKTKKISVEAEFALLGLLLSIISLIGLLDQGWLGGFLTYCLSYVFGSMYYIILIFNIYLGLYLFFKKKKPGIVLGVNALAFILLLFFMLVASSIFDGASLSSWFSHFNENFKEITVSSVKIDRSKISLVGGGLVGYVSYTLLAILLSDFGARLVIFITIVSCLYILLKKPINVVFKKMSHVFINLKNKISVNKKGKKNEIAYDKNEQVFEQIQDLGKEDQIVPIKLNFELEEEFQKESKIEKTYISDPLTKTEHVEVNESKQVDKEVEVKHSNVESKVSFDIFHDSIFEEDAVSQSNSQDYHNFDYNTVNDGYENIVDDLEMDTALNKENTVKNYTDEELEFYGEESLEDISNIETNMNTTNETSSVPFVREEVKPVKEEKTFDYEIEDVYSLLNENTENNAHNELKDEVEINCDRINQKLSELNIKASVNDYIIGPCVTRYEIVPEIGVRVSSIVNIENDLKLALAAVKTRMEAPIPGKSAVGIEVANKKRYPVYLKEVIYPFKDDDSKLLVGIGRDLNNKEVVLNIDKMPHLLVAGATGSGKSVCINSMIISLLLRTTPDEVKMILVDPKKVEMLPYANMPHLLCPVVTDPKKASVALKKVVKEMDRRYDEFANNGVRNIEGYNKLMRDKHQDVLPNIVVIIDELADLMLVAAKEVEESIQRITQLARAAGIYLVVATQRPSVDVITGVIKANIPSRIAFSVSSAIDSRTIIDRGGAEELLGKGDMLMDISGSGALNRVQGVYVSDEEIFNVVDYIKRKYSVNFDDEFLNLEEEKQEPINNLLISEDTNNDEKLYEEIKDFVIRNQKASTSLIQRYFTLGYARAARMIDRLEVEGIIGEANGAKPREVLMTYNKEEDSNE